MLYNRRVTELRRLQQITQEAWRRRGPAVEAHVGDLAWWSREPGYRTRVWGEEGWAWLIPPGEVDLLSVDRDAGFLRTMLDWFEANSEADELEVWALADDSVRIAELTRRGYERAEEPFFEHLLRNLDDLPPPKLPQGYTLRTIGNEEDVARRVAVHRLAFAPSTMTGEKYANLRRTWPYRAGLDLAIEAEDSSFSAFCTSWLDDENGVGELEPVGTHPEHGRRGLARAVCVAALHALREHGAERVLVYARGDAGHPAPLALYSSLGFRPVARHHRYVRTR